MFHLTDSSLFISFCKYKIMNYLYIFSFVLAIGLSFYVYGLKKGAWYFFSRSRSAENTRRRRTAPLISHSASFPSSLLSNRRNRGKAKPRNGRKPLRGCFPKSREKKSCFNYLPCAFLAASIWALILSLLARIPALMRGACIPASVPGFNSATLSRIRTAPSTSPVEFR